MKTLTASLLLTLHGCVTSASFSYTRGEDSVALTLHFRDSGKRVVPSK